MWDTQAMPGLFVAFEGGEGSGKSTAAQAVAEKLRGDGHEVVLCREPGGTEAGEEVRRLLHLDLTPRAELFAFMVARAEIVERVIRPAILRGALVLCDRFEASTFAYQGYGRGLPLDGLRMVNGFATAGLSPDLTIWLKIDPDVGLARKLGETEAIRTGLEALDFHRRVYDGYGALAHGNKTWKSLDGSEPAEDVARAAYSLVNDALYRIPRRV